MMPPTYRRRGFTLVEMMIVIAIIGVIASIAVPSFMRSRAEGQLTGCVQNLKAIDTALETYLIRHPATSDITVEMLVDAEYLKAAPKCPSTGTCCYSITPCGKPGSQMPYGAYALKCESNAHKAAGCDNGYPKLVTNGDIYYTKN
ncbi:prepilin-type N-terminal cleavage/methylation domain-containing protein [bacterium]|nr:prepilin-type N-terminal cleavage/methylation domain-containing protein [bacterium]